MSYTEIRPYFRQRMAALGGYREWTDGFNFENIPSTIIDNSYHLEFGTFNQIKQNQDCLDTSGQVTLRYMVKGYKTPQEGIDRAVSKGEAIIKESLKAINRATQPGIKNVKLGSFFVEPIQISNDNVIRGTIIFDITLVIEI